MLPEIIRISCTFSMSENSQADDAWQGRGIWLWEDPGFSCDLNILGELPTGRPGQHRLAAGESQAAQRTTPCDRFASREQGLIIRWMSVRPIYGASNHRWRRKRIARPIRVETSV